VKYSSRIAISAILFVVTVLVGSAVLAGAHEAPAERLKARLDGMDGITSSFVQEIDDGRGRVVEESTGELHLKKPNFRWAVEEPYPQVIVAEGAEVQIYDPDLEQLTEKTIGNSIEEAPMTLLTNPDLDLSEHFAVERVGEEGAELDHYVLTPRSEESLFASLELVFVDEALYSLIIHDHAGQRTRVEFVNFRTNQVIQSEVFQLDLPPGTDVVRG
jgi:outer membrane lipoprotein carrier protein